MSQSHRIHVIHENAVWSQPLFEELEALGLVEGRVELDREPSCGVFYDRMSASSHTRGHRFSPEYAPGREAIPCRWDPRRAVPKRGNVKQ